MVAIGGGAMYLALRGVEWSEFVAVLASVDVPMFLSGLGVFATLHLVRAIRWGDRKSTRLNSSH
jgi:hypothetical protein